MLGADDGPFCFRLNFLVTLVTFPSEKPQFEGIKKADEALRITPILFHDTSMKEIQGMVENVRFGVLFGSSPCLNHTFE